MWMLWKKKLISQAQVPRSSLGRSRKTSMMLKKDSKTSLMF
ncbi:hypothetical protein AB205_0112880 [Aquarana catesbeiana]|uniref:Uncharacterized protein n=1 Tax=Aquarana catesbeiana TaxID=8400 RepID=A0A2G9Q3H7_AQUCT|nr:hypothetical protein AB205_0112880 [Aquarana catesbeiana]